MSCSIDDKAGEDLDRVSFGVTPELRKEIERVRTHFPGASDAEIYSKAFTLLRIYLDRCDGEGGLSISYERHESGRREEVCVSIPGYRSS